MKTFITEGVCSRKIEFDTSDGIVKKVKFTGGCDGNSKAVASLVEGMSVSEVINRLKGICCENKKTSCGDQLAKALQSTGDGSF